VNEPVAIPKKQDRRRRQDVVIYSQSGREWTGSWGSMWASIARTPGPP
jgi:hypothetical protein